MTTELFNRFKSLIDDIENIEDVEQKFGPARLKPLFKRYNSCAEDFKANYPNEFDKLDLEDLPLYDEEGKEKFINEKVSTLLHQSKDMFSVLESKEDKKELKEYPDKITLSWLYSNVPVKFWISLGAILFIVFLLGAFIGKQDWFWKIILFWKDFKEMKG